MAKAHKYESNVTALLLLIVLFLIILIPILFAVVQFIKWLSAQMAF